MPNHTLGGLALNFYAAPDGAGKCFGLRLLQRFRPGLGWWADATGARIVPNPQRVAIPRCVRKIPVLMPATRAASWDNSRSGGTGTPLRPGWFFLDKIFGGRKVKIVKWKTTSSRRDNWKLASYEVAGSRTKNNLVPLGTTENVTTNIFHHIPPDAFGETPHIPSETFSSDDVRPDSQCIP